MLFILNKILNCILYCKLIIREETGLLTNSPVSSTLKIFYAIQ